MQPRAFLDFGVHASAHYTTPSRRCEESGEAQGSMRGKHPLDSHRVKIMRGITKPDHVLGDEVRSEGIYGYAIRDVWICEDPFQLDCAGIVLRAAPRAQFQSSLCDLPPQYCRHPAAPGHRAGSWLLKEMTMFVSFGVGPGAGF